MNRYFPAGGLLLAAWLACAPAPAATPETPSPAAAARRIPWQSASIKYVADHQDVKEVLRQLACS